MQHTHRLPPLHEPHTRRRFVQRSLLTLFAFVLILYSVIPAAAMPPPAATTPDLAAIDSYMDAQMREQHIPGLALGIVHTDEMIHQRGFGVAGPDEQSVTAQTTFSIGSLTKSFTAVALMQLVEAQKVALDAPVQRYLPWFRVADQDASARITIRHLLTHSSGLPRDFEGSEADAVIQGPRALETRLRTLQTVQLEQPLGTYGYSNVGYQVLAMVIETVSAQSYAAYVQQHIFAPLDMQHSYATLSEAASDTMARGYHYWFGLPVASARPPYGVGPGNGGLFSTAEDMSHYLIAHLNQGRFRDATLVSPASMAELHRPAVPRPDGAYAMGWVVSTDAGVTQLAHSGLTYNYMAKMILVPGSGWGVIVLQNSQYMVRLASGDYGQDEIADGVVALLPGGRPTQATTSLAPLLVYGALLLLLLVQTVEIVQCVRLLPSWQQRFSHHPYGKGRVLRYRAAQILNLCWALLILVGVPLTNNLAKMTYQMPDITTTFLVSGGVALFCGIIRTVRAQRVFHGPHAVKDAGIPLLHG